MHKLLVALALVVAGLATTSSADAATTSSAHATLTTRGGYIAPRACTRSRAGFKLVVDQAAISDFRAWSADVVVTGPGHYRDTTMVFWATDNGVWQHPFFCGEPNRAGTYRVRLRMDITHDSSYIGSHTYETLTTTFVIRTHR